METKKNVVILRSSHVLAGPEYLILDLATQLRNDKDINCILLCLWKNPGYPLPLLEEAEKRGLDVKRIDAWGRFNFWMIPRVLSFIRKNRIDLIHTMGYRADIVGLTVARLARLPVICHIPGFVESYYRTRAYNLITLLSARYFDRVIACSDSVARTVSAARVRREKLVTIRNCVSFERCIVGVEEVDRVKKELRLADGVRIVANLARLDPEKGHIYLLRAAKEVLARFENVKFVIIGDGRLQENLEYAARRMGGIAENIIFTGYRRDAQAILSLATVVAFPSLKEGIPLAMLQGMALGKPVVASAVDGIPEVIKDGVNGYLVPPADYKALADALEKLLSDAELSASMGEMARKTVEEEYRMEVMAERIGQVYRQLWAERERSDI
ncbi:MAG: hypothetical protein A3G93_03435 [Nitrospinae bacterium RIFCSPLOWO2_12_FULL_45_22]|nr:MAG: hypothetical protein A3G93_03435 [Nitrospinae bacterium RIFCSPLOWO2_12_FULL_45_22]